MDYESLSNDYVLHAARREKSLIFERAEGSRVWDIHGKVYLDTMSGSAGPAMVGHAHPAVTEAVARQMAKLPSTNVLHSSVPVIEFCARLAAIAPPGLTKTFLCTGGGEAVEAAIKFATRVTGRSEVISLTGAYHGMSLATMGLSGMAGAAEVDARARFAGRHFARFLQRTRIVRHWEKGPRAGAPRFTLWKPTWMAQARGRWRRS